MRELGEDALALHRECGVFAKEHGVAKVYSVGELSADVSRPSAKTERILVATNDLIAAVCPATHGGQSILVKGSQFYAHGNHRSRSFGKMLTVLWRR